MRLLLESLAATAIAVAELSLLAGCSPAPAPVASSTQNPSNPSAPEGVDPVLAVNVTTSARDAGPVVYVCPMHAEVTSPEPGSCPKCGMVLVPKK